MAPSSFAPNGDEEARSLQNNGGNNAVIADRFKDEDDDEDSIVLGPSTRSVGIPCGLSMCLTFAILVGTITALVVSFSSNNAQHNSKVKSSKLGANNGGTRIQISDATIGFFRDSTDLSDCDKDPHCQRIQDAVFNAQLNEDLDAGDDVDIDWSFETPCQIQSRDWLRGDPSLYDYTDDRIRQRYAMSVFFCELDGGAWVQNEGWLSDSHECDWFSSLRSPSYPNLDPCNQREQLEVLRLHENQLQGNLPSELAMITSLFELTVTDNIIEGSLPKEYAALSDLDTLCVGANLLEGSAASLINQFPDMVYLDFSFNAYTGTIPNSIATNNPDLAIFYVEHNSISGSLPTELGLLGDLERLSVDGNELTGTLPAEIGNCYKLERMFAQNNFLMGSIPDSFSNLGQLDTLALQKNEGMDGTVPETICHLPNLEDVSVSVNVGCNCCGNL